MTPRPTPIFVCEGPAQGRGGPACHETRQESSLVVASYGDNWYESKSSLDLDVDGQSEIEFTITPLDSRNASWFAYP